MADSMTSNLWLLDSAGVKRALGRGFFTTGFKFSDYAADGDQAVLLDGRGVEIVTFTGSGADADTTKSQPLTYEFHEPTWINGLNIATLDSGKIQVVIV